MLIIGNSVDKALVYKDREAFLMYKLDSVVNQEKFLVIKTQIIEFLDMKIDSRAIYLSPRIENSKNQIEMSETLPEPLYIHFRIDKSPGSLNLHDLSSALHFHYLQLQLNQALKVNGP